MIVGKMFPGDPMWIAHIQHDLYHKYVGIIFDKARKEYLKAESIIGVNTELGDELRKPNRIDHRTIQELHDVIAGKFRFNWLVLKNQQFDLFKSPEAISESPSDIANQWRIFLDSELDAIFKDSPDLIKHICVATIYANPDEHGCVAEDHIYEYIQRYKAWIIN